MDLREEVASSNKLTSLWTQDFWRFRESFEIKEFGEARRRNLTKKKKEVGVGTGEGNGQGMDVDKVPGPSGTSKNSDESQTLKE